MASPARRVEFSALVQEIKAQLHQEGPAAESEIGLVGRHFRLLGQIDTKDGTNFANTYANQALLIQVAKIKSLLDFKLSAPADVDTSNTSFSQPEAVQTGLNIALATLGLQASATEEAHEVQEVLIPADIQEAQTRYMQGHEFTALTETVEALDNLESQQALVQSALRLEMAKTAVYIQDFFGNVQNKEIDQDALDLLQHVFQKMNLELTITEASSPAAPATPAHEEPSHRSIIKDIALGFYLQESMSQSCPFVNQEFAKVCFFNIIQIMQKYTTEDKSGFNAQKFNREKASLQGPHPDDIAYVEALLEQSEVNDHGTTLIAPMYQVLAQDFKFITELWGPQMDFPLYIIEEMIQGYMQQMERAPNATIGKLYLGGDKTQYYEIELTQAPLQIAQIIFKMIEEQILIYSNNGESDFDLDKFRASLQAEGYTLLKKYIEEITQRLKTRNSTELLEELRFHQSKIIAFYLKQVQERQAKAAEHTQDEREESAPPISQPGFFRRHAGKVVKTATAVAGAAAAYAYLLPLLL